MNKFVRKTFRFLVWSLVFVGLIGFIILLPHLIRLRIQFDTWVLGLLGG